MDFLLDNPLAMMDGPAFLVLFASLIIFSTIAVAVVRALIDKSDKLNIPTIPPDPDPVEIAYLRGGPNEASRSVIFSLLQKRLIQIETNSRGSVLKPVLQAERISGLSGIEQTSIEWIGSVREAGEVFRKDKGLVAQLRPYFSVYQDRLEGRQLLTAEESYAAIKRYSRAAAAFVIVLGGYKVLTSIVYGHFNFIFTIVLAAIGMGILLALGQLPRITKLGKLYLERLNLAFSDLKYRSQAPYLKNAEEPSLQSASFAGVDPLMLSVGLFGSGILAGTVFSDYNTAFRRSQMEEAKRGSGGGGCGSAGCGSCSSGSGSSCSSGDGGGGCGGGGCGGGCGGDMEAKDIPYLGVGLGFRDRLRSDIFIHRGAIDFLEITADHYLDANPRKREELEMLREHFTLIPHSLDLSLGSAEGIDDEYLNKLAALIEYVRPPWFSDHICFTKAGGVKIGHLAPVPYTNEALDVFARNIEKVKATISTPLILENITYDLKFPSSEMSEAKFISRLINENDCGLLLDAANLYINSQNNNYDWRAFLDELPLERVVQLHFVGSHRHDGRLIDAHADRTDDEIWNVLQEICVRCDIRGAILERDENFPEFSELLDELETARERKLRSCSVRDADQKIQPIRSSVEAAA